MKDRLNSAFLFTVALVMSLAIFTPVDARAEETREVTDEGITVNGWKLMKPEFGVSSTTGKRTVTWHFKNGTATDEVVPGQKIKFRWEHPTKTEWNETPPGYAIEDTNALISWWQQGGRMPYSVSRNGNWVPTTKPADTNSGPAGSGPNQNNPPPSGTGGSSGNQAPPGIAEALKILNEARIARDAMLKDPNHTNAEKIQGRYEKAVLDYNAATAATNSPQQKKKP